VCIADEVQSGLGRVGKWWAFELQGVVPDIVTIAKPIGNGHPLGAVICRKEISDAFDNGMEYFNTCGGNPVSMKIGFEVIKVIKEEDIMKNCQDVGEFMQKELVKLKEKHISVGDFRGVGLFWGIEIVKDRKNKTPGGVEA
jgi:4-aminobutyrate aminotransferase-like enzyme